MQDETQDGTTTTGAWEDYLTTKPNLHDFEDTL